MSSAATRNTFSQSAAYFRSSPDRQERLRNYVQRHTGEHVDVRLTPSVETAAVMPASEDALLEAEETDFDNQEAERLIDATDGDYLALITTQPTDLDKLGGITRQVHADRNFQMGAALHELLHILHTNSSYIRKQLSERVDEQYQDLVHELINLVEDAAIEKSVFDSDKWTKRAENRLITSRKAVATTVEDIPTPVEFGLWDAISGIIYERGIFDSGKTDILLNHDDDRIRFQNEGVRQVVESLQPRLEEWVYETRSKPDSKDRTDAIIDFWENVLKPIFDQANSQQQSSGQSDGESDEGEESRSGPSPQSPNQPSVNEQDQENGQGSDSGSETPQQDQSNADSEETEQGGENKNPVPDDLGTDDIDPDIDTSDFNPSIGRDVGEMPNVGENQPTPTNEEENDSSNEADGSQTGKDTNGSSQNEPEEAGSGDEKQGTNDSEGADNANSGEDVDDHTHSPDSDSSSDNGATDQTTLGAFDQSGGDPEDETDAGEESNQEGGEDVEDQDATPGQELDEQDTTPHEDGKEDPGSGHDSEPAVPNELNNDISEEIEDETSAEMDQVGPDADQIDQELDELERALSESAGEETLDQLRVTDNRADEIPPHLWEEIKAEAKFVGRTLRKTLEKSRNDSRRSGLTSGRLDRRQLGKVGLGDPHGFSVDLSGDDKKYDLVFVLDGSGSMRGSKMQTATEAIARLTVAAEDIGINVAVTGFRNGAAELIKPFSVDSDFARDKLLNSETGGGTPLAQALSLARNLLETESHRGHKPMIVTMTDGIPADVDAVREELQQTQAPVQSLTIATDTTANNPPDRADELTGYYDGHTYIFDPDRLDDRLDDLIAQFAGY
ncbi:VWA domain-containing protein [Halodesulfurarchaeum sp. HSR-GB]|uniref:VWA domain-containing protein n=1 Tax=Halodesulfurarchaeum sp. HSR-GB TaxID=3074077 RepID=UPI00286370E0|nr:VWA domain-containing protein [Halodesulfurarchaeum sp. HSR-GB]MDR5657684.1 VWA domain-containing protein [Halodesulfurarchaeum sp. HSR-GB]